MPVRNFNFTVIYPYLRSTDICSLNVQGFQCHLLPVM